MVRSFRFGFLGRIIISQLGVHHRLGGAMKSNPVSKSQLGPRFHGATRPRDGRMLAFKSPMEAPLEKSSVRRETYRSRVPVNYPSFDVDYGHLYTFLSTHMVDFRPYPPKISTPDRKQSTSHPKVFKSITTFAQTI